MKILNFASISLLLLISPALRAEPAAMPIPVATDPIAEALPILQTKYIGFKELGYKPGDKLGDLVARSNGGISLSVPDSSAQAQPITTASLPGNIIYWRLASFTPQTSWLDLATQLQKASGTAPGIILDLRSNVAPDDYHGAAQVMGLLAPDDKAMGEFEAIGVDHGVRIPDHPFRSPIVALVNAHTTGAAEALAAFLRSDGALVVGRPTSGRAAVFAEEKLTSGQALRFVAENIVTRDGASLFGHPVIPDICLTVDDHSEKAALVLIKDNHIDDVIQESAERHRLSEASLVQGQDPEWDDYLASLENKPVLLSLPVIHDVVLISALDSLKAIRFSEQSLPPQQATANASLPASTSIQ